MLASLSYWIAWAPLWLIGLVVFGAMIVAAIIGGALRRLQARSGSGREKAGDGESGDMSLVVSAVMGLLALLIAFTFGIALDRFDTRRVNVLDEANAIGTTYLRTQLLEAPHRERISRLLVAYTDVRLSLATSRPGPGQDAQLATNDRLIADLWSATVAAAPSMRPYPYSHAFFDAMNNLIDMDSARKAGRQARVPSEVFLVLFLYQIVAAGLINYAVSGKLARRSALLLFALFCVLMLLIIDIDRPNSGGVRESQEPMRQLRDFMRASPPESFDRFSLAPEPAP